MMRHLEHVQRAWSLLEKTRETESVILSGDQNSLEPAQLVAVARYTSPSTSLMCVTLQV